MTIYWKIIYPGGEGYTSDKYLRNEIERDFQNNTSYGKWDICEGVENAESFMEEDYGCFDSGNGSEWATRGCKS
jgi:hypothetical protein